MKGRVARHQADRTNQKIYFTRIYCQLAEQCEDHQLKQAHIETAIFHLYGIYLAFLQEISNFYGLKHAQPTLEDIEIALENKTQVSPEILRLKRAKREDFLAEIEKAWQQVLYKPVPTVNEKGNDVSAKLPVIDVMSQSEQITASHVSTDLVRQWRTELLTLIETLREGMNEY